MRYQGSKKSLAKELLPIILEHKRPDQIWVECFVGGANMIDKVPGRRIGNDLHPNLIAMWKALQDGWVPPDTISELEYGRLKKEALQKGVVSPLHGFVGFGVAFGGIFFDTYARDEAGTNYLAQSWRTVMSQIKNLPKEEVFFYNGSYDKFPIPPRSLIYCDPPYADTAGYSVGSFDHRKFWKWANDRVKEGHDVFVSEYTAPPDWVPIWQKKLNTKLNASVFKDSTEKLFVRAAAYDEQAASEYYEPPLHKLYTLKQVLHFVAGAARKDESHIVIENLRATASNANMTISAPINVPFNIKPNAKTFSAAIKVADETKAPVAMEMTAAGRLKVQSDKFKTFVECLDDYALPQPIFPQGNFIDDLGEVWNAVKAVAPFMSTDDLRPWSKAIYFGPNTCMSTNNVVFGEYWHGRNLPFSFIIDSGTIQQLLAIDEQPVMLQANENSATFWFEGERFISTTLVDSEWPVKKIEANLNKPSDCVPIPENFFENLAKLKRFSGEDEHVYITADSMRTHHEKDKGAESEFATGVTGQVCFGISFLLQLDGIATKIDWSAYPHPCFFFGNKLRGLILGRTLG